MARPDWVGFDNFQALFADPLFGTAWRNTLLFTGLALVIGFARAVRAWRSCSTSCGT